MKGDDFMSTATCNFNIRMDSDIKSKCEELYRNLGMNLTTAINIFLRQSLQHGGLPFEVRMKNYNQETIDAMIEARNLAKNPSAKVFDNVEDALAELKR